MSVLMAKKIQSKTKKMATSRMKRAMMERIQQVKDMVVVRGCGLRGGEFSFFDVLEISKTISIS